VGAGVPEGVTSELDLVDRDSGSLATGGDLRPGVQALRDEW
jgi:hypothetical protein